MTPNISQTIFPLPPFGLLGALCESQLIQLSVVSDEWLVDFPQFLIGAPLWSLRPLWLIPPPIPVREEILFRRSRTCLAVVFR